MLDYSHVIFCILDEGGFPSSLANGPYPYKNDNTEYCSDAEMQEKWEYLENTACLFYCQI